MKGKNVLVTGAPGWLGDSLVYELRKKGAKVRCLVLEGFDASHLEKVSAEIFRGDLTKPETLRGCCKGVEIVFHCAGIIHPKKLNDLYFLNYEGTKNILDEAVGAGVRKFVLVSSNSPFGFNKDGSLFDEKSPYRPYRAYGKSKMLAEKYVNKAHQEKKIDATIVRPCWFYGPNQPLRQTTFFKMIKKGNPIIFGKGNNLRSMAYIDNAIQGLILAATKPQASGQTYWITDEKPYSTNEIYETIADLLGVKLKPRRVPHLSSACCRVVDGILQSLGIYNKEFHVAGEMDQNIACSVEKAKKELGYSPKISLKEGMRRSIDWCRKQGVDI